MMATHIIKNIMRNTSTNIKKTCQDLISVAKKGRKEKDKTKDTSPPS